jgi:hypothetical protein
MRVEEIINVERNDNERDEIELANFIINKLDADPHYAPSEKLLQAIRAINDKLAGTSSLHGMVRTV